MTPLEIVLIVYPSVAAVVLMLAWLVFKSEYDHGLGYASAQRRKYAARFILTFWAWPIWAICGLGFAGYCLWHFIGELLEEADWARGKS